MSEFNLDTEFCKKCGRDGGLCNGCEKKKVYKQGMLEAFTLVDTLFDFAERDKYWDWVKKQVGVNNE